MLRNSLLYLLILLCSCTGDQKNLSHSEPQNPLAVGSWRMVLDLGEAELPVQLNIRQEGGFKVDFLNSDEVITAYQYIHSGDSLYVRMPLFDSEFCGVISNDGRAYSGLWRNYGRANNYSLPFEAKFGDDYRFCDTKETGPVEGLSDKYEVHFSPGIADDEYAAIGLFKASPTDNSLTGTFLTETGDYRFLEGNVCEGSFALSCFDGSHAFLFTADWDGTELSNGIFRSGSHWAEPWTAVASNSFELRNPDELTFVTDSSKVWSTSMFDQDGRQVSLNTLQLDNKVVIIQALGSWCPNCIDESRDYVEFYNRFHDRGLEIIPITFEKTTDPGEAKDILEELKSDLDMPFPVYYGGERSKSIASEVFPALNHIMSFPTSIVIGRDGSVRKVHTGFYGPSTGLYYEHWKHDTELLLDKLLSEEV